MGAIVRLSVPLSTQPPQKLKWLSHPSLDHGNTNCLAAWKIRAYGDICNDCLMSSFCGLCVLCQLKRDVDATKADGTLNNIAVRYSNIVVTSSICTTNILLCSC